MKTEELITKIEATKEVITEEHNKWRELYESRPLDPKDNNFLGYGIEGLEDSFIEIENAIDYFLFSIKG